MTETTAKGRIVVGVDGSGASTAALIWAAAQAEPTGAELDVVTVWLHDSMLDDASVNRTLEEARTVHLHELESLVTAVTKDHPGVTARCSAPDGDPAEVLTGRAKGATMLVVGSHGRGRLREALAGSVAKACLRRASCPVAVIPPPARAPESPLGRRLAEVVPGKA
ncbi:MAG TPA: universal stress protein [Amycolatopsis sp.]|uniref:Universal stress protein n=1 Tax=Amycolatopsis nalaikhensis TaxID=715472 RepID=A0ABY8XE96_9PSEU|nr:universal stress protein [Amycolatopsis sp. 2-2]WIV53944.1 universal stress protein [Amycolatopsis sp. 2-2]HWD05310.1 universal stress protein [Amycolatopsis sp.]